MQKVAEKKFKSELFLERSITPHLEPLGMAENTMTLYISEDGLSGNIEWEYEFPDGEADGENIGLDIDGKSITGYDGVFSMPEQALDLLRENGFDVSEIE